MVSLVHKKVLFKNYIRLAGIRAFTLLEICIAIAVAALVMVAAVPSLTGLFENQSQQAKFEQFDALVREAHERSVKENRTYLLVWAPRYVLLRADDELSDGEKSPRQAKVTRRKWPFEKTEKMKLILPAALTKNPEAVWSFWPNGTCESVTIEFSGKSGGWVARYNSLTVAASVHYD
jgi:type II secretory pathway pseudopilin PulG